MGLRIHDKSLEIISNFWGFQTSLRVGEKLIGYLDWVLEEAADTFLVLKKGDKNFFWCLKWEGRHDILMTSEERENDFFDTKKSRNPTPPLRILWRQFTRDSQHFVGFCLNPWELSTILQVA